MIYENSKEITTWKDELGKKFTFKGVRKFYLTSHYQGARIVDKKTVVTFTPEFGLEPFYTAIVGGAAVERRYLQKVVPVRGGKKGETQIGYQPEKIIFRNGVLEVRANQLDLYWFLINHPRCETNPQYVDKDGKPKDDQMTLAMATYSHFLFKERNEVLEQEQTFDKQKEIIKAQNWVVNECTEKEARELYKLFGEADWEEATLARIKNYLLAKAGENPQKFMEELDSEIRTFKSKIGDAMQAEVIFFDKMKKVWKWSGVKGESILAVAKGDDPIVKLAKHLQLKDNGELWEAICDKVKEAEEVAI